MPKTFGTLCISTLVYSGLKGAVSSRNLILAVETLDQVKEKGYENEMTSEIKQAEKMIREIEYLENV